MKKVIPSLNGLRAISILFVLFQHFQLHNLHMERQHGGQLGVNVFFIISGFLITILLLKEESKYGEISLKNFYIRRSLRILPVYYILLFSYFILQLAGILNLNSVSWISSLTYTKYFFSKGENWEVGHLWSLSVEEHFYLIWPIVFLYFKRYRQSFSILVIIAVFITRLITDVPVTQLFTRADALMFGCLFALNYKKLVTLVEKSSFYFLIMPFILLILFVFGGERLIPIHNEELRKHISLAFIGSFGTITDICISFIIIISITCKNNIYFKILNSSLFNYLGILSYSIYIWQQIFFSDNVGWLSSFPINLLFIFIVAFVSYNFIEQPFLKLKNRFNVEKRLGIQDSYVFLGVSNKSKVEMEKLK